MTGHVLRLAFRGDLLEPPLLEPFDQSGVTGDNVSCSERKKELKRRRHRGKKFRIFSRKLQTATVSERGVIAEKLRSLTPGCNEVIDRWELEKKR